VKRFESLAEAMDSDAMPLPTFDVEAYLATFPHDRVAGLASSSVRPGQRFDLRGTSGTPLDTFFGFEGFDLRDGSGVWMTDTRAAIATVVRATPGEQLALTFSFSPTDQGALADSLSLRAQANGSPVKVVRWTTGGRVEVTVTFTATAADTPVQLDLELVDGGPAKRRSARDARRIARNMLPTRIASPYRGGVLSWVRISSVPR
jgi:hypothetical protein